MVLASMEQWQQELSQSLRSLEDLKPFFSVSDKGVLEEVVGMLPLRITPHTASIIDWENVDDPILRMSIPSEGELAIQTFEHKDPIGDHVHEPVPHLTHRYHNRALVHLTNICAQHCRFCFRRCRQFTGVIEKESFDRILIYLQDHPEVEEVIFTGGDPLVLPDDQLSHHISSIASIETIKRLRIHSRIPVVLPSRVTEKLLFSLIDACQGKALTIVTHFNHAQEIAEENRKVIEMIRGAKILIKNQHVLLKGVNDSVEVLADLYQQLFDLDVELYYLHQLDLAKGTQHFRVPISKGLALMKALREQVPHLKLPTYMLDIPRGGGKVNLESENAEEMGKGVYQLKNFKGKVFQYRDPGVLS